MPHIKLVSPDDKYLNFIYEIESDVSEKYLWSDQRNIPNKQNFAQEFHDRLNHYYFTYFIITDMQNEPIGFIYTTQYHPWDHHLYITIYIKKKYRRTLVAAEAGILTVDYLFKYYKLKKIYTMVYDYNDESRNYQITGGFVEEGLMRQHRFYNGEYHDVHLMALYPDVFYKKNAKALKSLLEDEQ